MFGKKVRNYKKAALLTLGAQLMAGGTAGATAYVAAQDGNILQAGDTVTVVDNNMSFHSSNAVTSSASGIQLGTGAIHVNLTTQEAVVSRGIELSIRTRI